MKRIMILVLAMTTGLGVLAFTTHSAPQADDVKVIRITAKKFDFTPSEITVKRGVPVELELTSSEGSMDSASRISSSRPRSSLVKSLASCSRQIRREN